MCAIEKEGELLTNVEVGRNRFVEGTLSGQLEPPLGRWKGKVS